MAVLVEVEKVSFEATMIRLGIHKCEPTENVVFSVSEVRVVVCDPTEKAKFTFSIGVSKIVKTVCCFGNDTKILFHIPKNEMKIILNRFSSSTANTTDSICQWIYIRTSALTEADQSRISNIFKQLDIISPDEMQQMIDMLFGKKYSQSCSKEDVRYILKYPPNGKFPISIDAKDYECLAVDEYLNDIIIDFYIEYLRCEVLTPEQRERTHFFSSLFFEALTKTVPRSAETARLTATQKRHGNVKQWTKNDNIFQKDFVIIPINKDSHWFLSIICYPSLKEAVSMDTGESLPKSKKRAKSTKSTKSKTSKDMNDNDNDDQEVTVKRPCILMFDSLGGSKETEIKIIRDYLNCEYAAKMQDDSEFKFDDMNMPGQDVRVPFQPNMSDCGLFLLQNIEHFFKDPIKSYELPIEGLDNWYDPDDVVKKRKSIAMLIQNKMRHQNISQKLPQIKLPD